jgi:hypothetical protein
MVAALINLVVVLLIVGVIWWAIEQLLPLIPLPAPIAQVVRVLLIVILALVIIFALLGLLPGGSGYSFRLLK